ncbi:zinc finger protein 862-like [Tachypleus tridentatus]|uniref:zinc finger protein 862-like n=1 Tax=Tachypleus tridentatus TaxID=6853 RepID=UPI003FD31644
MRSVMADRRLFYVELVELATDGANVMVGIKTGVATKFKEECPWIITSHCLAHRLQLAAEKAANQVPYLVKYISILNQFAKSLKYYPKLCRLREESKALHGEKSNKIKQLFFTRWLSFNDSVQALVNCIASVAGCLQVVAMERGTPGRALLNGLVQQMSCYSFVMMTHFLADAVGILGLLSRSLQRVDLFYDQAKAIIDGSIQSLVHIPGPYTETALKELLQAPDASGYTSYRDHDIKDIDKQHEKTDQLLSHLLKRWSQDYKLHFQTLTSCYFLQYLAHVTAEQYLMRMI